MIIILISILKYKAKLMKRKLSFLQTVLTKFDLFPASQFLRYKQQADYKTATGGFVSITIIVIFVIMFYNLGTQTINREIINGSVSYNIEVQPEPLSFKFVEKSDFMFSVGIGGLNLSDPNVRYFNISLRQNVFSPIYQPINIVNVPLVQCTPQHFSYSEDIQNFYTQFNLSTNLCPPFDYQFTVGGRLTSSILSTFSVYVSYCNKTIDQKCLSPIELEYLQSILGGSFTLYVPTISTIVNIGDEVYKQIYIEDRNYFYFTTQLGLEIVGQVQMYQIDTDVSLMPYTDIQTEYIKTIPELFQAKSKAVYDNCYAQIKFTKSNVSTSFSRSFNKLDNYFSYVGGLVGTILLFFYLLSNYSQKSFTVDIAAEIYDLSEEEPPSLQKNFNFAFYVSIFIQQFFSFFRMELNWKQTQKFAEAVDEMEKQLSIAYLLKRLNYFEDALTSILTHYQIQTLYLTTKKTIGQAALARRQSSFSKDIFKIHLNEENAAEEESGGTLNIKSLQQDYLCKGSPAALKREIKQPKLQEINDEKKTQILQEIKKSTRIDQIKESLIQVIRESYEGNQISSRIMSKVSKVVQEMGFSQPKQQSHQFAVSNDHKERQMRKDKNRKSFKLQLEQIK